MDGDINPFDEMGPALARGLDNVGGQMVAHVKESLAQICTEYYSKKGGQKFKDKRHSAPGENPRYETGRLLGSIAHEVTSEGGTITLLVDTDVKYAFFLEVGMDRPIFSATPSGGTDVLTLFEPIALDAISAEIEK